MRPCWVETIMLVISGHDSSTNFTEEGVTGHWSRVRDVNRPMLGAIACELAGKNGGTMRAEAGLMTVQVSLMPSCTP